LENKRAGFSFKAVGVVGFVLLTFLLIRVLRLPDGAVTAEVMPNFLMLLLGVLVLASSFILLALGRIVELLQGLTNTKALLNEIRDETERIRIESQYIYEVQKDTLVKLTNVDETPVVDPYIEHQAQVAKAEAQNRNRDEDSGEVNELLTTDKGSGVDNLAKSEMVNRNASYAASRLSKNIDQTKSTLTQTDVAGTQVEDQIQESGLDTDIKSNTDESTWSTLSDYSSTSNTDVTSTVENVSNELDESSEKASLLFDKVGDLPVLDAESDAAALDGSDDVVDDVPQPKVWKPVSEDELTPKDSSVEEKADRLDSIGSQKFVEAKEVKDAEINASLDETVDGLEPIKPQSNTKISEAPVFTDRLSQTEKTSEKAVADNAVRFGSFPAASNEHANDSLSTDDTKTNFTLEDITDENFVDDSVVNSTFDRRAEARQEVYSQEEKTESLADVFATKNESTNSTKSANTESDSSIAAKGFSTVEDNFESAEDSFDDIREVFDTKAKKLSSSVRGVANASEAQDRIKDGLKGVTDKISKETSEIGKNLN